MSEPIKIQDLIDGRLDVQSLGEAANGDENTTVVTRTGETYPSAKKAIKTMFEAGGLPAVPFTTKALMTASALADSQYAIVTDDAVDSNNGLYKKTAGAWSKSAYDTAVQSKIYTDSQINNLARLRANIVRLMGAANSNLLSSVSKTNGYYLDASGNAVAFSSFSYTDYITIDYNAEYLISQCGNFVGAYYDDSKTFITPITAPLQVNNNFSFKPPSSARFMRINVDTTVQTTLVNKSVADVQPIDFTADVKPMSAWRDKKIAWYGTSIPAGAPQSNRDIWSYANLAVHDLGGEIINNCVGGSGVASTTTGSFLSLSSYVNYQNSLLNIINTPQHPDLVVFDFGVNDYVQAAKASIDKFDHLDPFDKNNLGTKTKIDTRDITTFIGAYNTVVDMMLTKNQTIKFAFLTHFSHDNAQSTVNVYDDYFKPLNICIEAVAKYWSAPCLKVYEHTNFRCRNGFNSITPFMPDDIHPASGDGRAVQTLRNVVRDFLISIG
ncbi:hypothetical protein [Psychrobacter sp. 16-MNA-CIBAN-0192]|uniref:hypothetical protein n=1 Tax=Psychrobacter sp. 16-MNA-CIBAN-0192 TaxID=3140448 RepID=UPI0033168867